jgi:hypothetical protein
MTDEDIARLLASEGSAWRATQPPPVEPDADRYRRPRWRTLPRTGWALVGAPLVAILVVSGSFLVQHAGAPDVRPVAVGSSATATGFVVISPSAPAMLCSNLVARLSYGAVPSCEGESLQLSGIDPSTLPGSTQSDGRIVSSRVELSGTWDGRVLVVSAVRLALPSASPQALSCDGPTAWPTQPTALIQIEEAARRLQARIATQPDVFAGTWPLQGAADSPPVVGTVGDPAAVRPALDAVYPYGVCIAKVRYSDAELRAAAASLQVANPEWQVQVAYPENAVIVRLLVYDDSAASTITKYPEAQVQATLVGTP